MSLSGSDLSFSISLLQHVCIRNRCSFSLSEAVIRPPCCFEFCKRDDDPKKKCMLLCELRCHMCLKIGCNCTFKGSATVQDSV